MTYIFLCINIINEFKFHNQKKVFMTKNVLGFLVICDGKILLFQSKANASQPNQFDPECCSDSFESEAARIKKIKKYWFPEQSFSKKILNQNIFFHRVPIKFNYKDDLGQKLVTAYVLEIKHKNFIHDLLKKEQEQNKRAHAWIPIDSILNKTAPVYISALFYKLIAEKMPNEIELKWKHLSADIRA